MQSSYHRLELSERLISAYRINESSDPAHNVPASWEKDARVLLSEVFGSEEDVTSLSPERLFYMLIAARERCHREHVSEAISVQINSAFIQSYPFKLVMGAVALTVAVSLGGTVGAGIVSFNLKTSLEDANKSTTDTLQAIADTKKSFDDSAKEQLESLNKAAPKLNEFEKQLTKLEKSTEEKQRLVDELVASRTKVVSEVATTAQQRLAAKFESQEAHIKWANTTLEQRISSLEDEKTQLRPHATVKYQRINGKSTYLAPQGTTTDDWSILIVPASPGLKPGCCDREFDFKLPNSASKLDKIQHSGDFEGFAAYAVESPDHKSWGIVSYTIIEEGAGSGRKKTEGQLVAVVLIPK